MLSHKEIIFGILGIIDGGRLEAHLIYKLFVAHEPKVVHEVKAQIKEGCNVVFSVGFIKLHLAQTAEQNVTFEILLSFTTISVGKLLS